MEAVCERTRSYVSLELDRHLSELERAFLATHVSECDDCRDYRSQIHELVGRIRAAPSELPERRAVVPPARPAFLDRVRLGVAASFALALVGTASLVAPSVDPERAPDDHDVATLSSSRQPDPLLSDGGIRGADLIFGTVDPLTERGAGFDRVL